LDAFLKTLMTINILQYISFNYKLSRLTTILYNQGLCNPKNYKDHHALKIILEFVLPN